MVASSALALPVRAGGYAIVASGLEHRCAGRAVRLRPSQRSPGAPDTGIYSAAPAGRGNFTRPE
ncbi:hypothetical protein GCM10018779_01830 [Streptomyces griseocarneus]|nr:hypothetical protein GCM10018779_01830 [Streptomyces griseocarneus]